MSKEKMTPENHVKLFSQAMKMLYKQNDVNVGYGDRIYYPNNDVREDDVEKLMIEKTNSFVSRYDNHKEIRQYAYSKGLLDGINLAKENTYTEEQVRDIVLRFAEESTFLRQGIAILWVKNYFKSLKQPKQ